MSCRVVRESALLATPRALRSTKPAAWLPAHTAAELCHLPPSAGAASFPCCCSRRRCSATAPAPPPAACPTAAPAAAAAAAGALILGSGHIPEVQRVINDVDDFTAANMLAGDADLTALIPGYDTYDATALEFDVVPAKSGELVFQYIFASEGE